MLGTQPILDPTKDEGFEPEPVGATLELHRIVNATALAEELEAAYPQEVEGIAYDMSTNMVRAKLRATTSKEVEAGVLALMQAHVPTAKSREQKREENRVDAAESLLKIDLDPVVAAIKAVKDKDTRDALILLGKLMYQVIASQGLAEKDAPTEIKSAK